MAEDNPESKLVRDIHDGATTPDVRPASGYHVYPSEARAAGTLGSAIKCIFILRRWLFLDIQSCGEKLSRFEVIGPIRSYRGPTEVNKVILEHTGDRVPMVGIGFLKRR